MMELYKLNYFLAVARTENLQRAAEVIHASPAALSKAISSLEEEFGVTLFERIGRNIRLTTAGRHLQLRVGQLIELADTIKAEVSPSTARINARLSGREWLLSEFGLPLMTKIGEKYQDVCFDLNNCSGDESIKLLESGDSDFALTVQLPPQHLESKMINRFSLVTCIGENHPLSSNVRQRKKTRIADVLKFDFASPNSSLFVISGARQSIDGWRDDHHPRQIRWHVESVSLLADLINSGQAVAYVPGFWAQKHGFFILNIPDCSFECEVKVYLSIRRSERGSWCKEIYREFTKTLSQSL